MYDFDQDTDSTSTVFRDVILLALAGFIAIVILLLPHINPPKQDESKDIPPPGNLMVQMFWDDTLNVDIDLWSQAPDDIPVGYNSLSGKLFDLLRDDRGFSDDTSNRNFEIAITRGVVAGEYTINVMFYKDYRATSEQKYPIEVHVIVSLKKDNNKTSKLKKLFEKKVKLWHVFDDITVFNFRLDSEFNVVPGSLNEIYKRIAPLSVSPSTPDGP